LTQSAVCAKPDIELVNITSRLNIVHDMIDVCTKPFIYDADTGGLIEHL
jgi:2-methylisocitrate lyase-like PEP mutase family enzyme